mgnify:CR=1 FL=1
MATLVYAKISTIHYANGSADIALQDRENQVILNVPFLAWFYEMPKAGDIVAALIEEANGRIQKSVILGKIFIGENTPKNTGKDMFCKEFADGANMKYKAGECQFNMDRVRVNELICKRVIQEE